LIEIFFEGISLTSRSREPEGGRTPRGRKGAREKRQFSGKRGKKTHILPATPETSSPFFEDCLRSSNQSEMRAGKNRGFLFIPKGEEREGAWGAFVYTRRRRRAGRKWWEEAGVSFIMGKKLFLFLPFAPFSALFSRPQAEGKMGPFRSPAHNDIILQVNKMSFS